VPAHHLDDEGALVTGRGAVQGVQGLDDAVQRGVGADRHVGAEHVVVDRADHPDQVQVLVRLGRLRVQLARVDQLLEQLRPLLAEQVGAGEAAVAADHDEPVDAPVDQVADGPAAAVAGAEVRRPGGADEGAAALQDAADIGGLEAADEVAALDEALVALEHGVHVDPVVQRGADDRADGRVHPTGITAAGEHRDAGGRRRPVTHGSPSVAPTLRCRT
jgi:hypothetical protein